MDCIMIIVKWLKCEDLPTLLLMYHFSKIHQAPSFYQEFLVLIFKM